MIEVIPSAEKERLQKKLHSLRERTVALDASLLREVESIIDNVRSRGDEALVDYAARFDGYQQRVSQLRVSVETLEHAASQVDAKFLVALAEAIRNVRSFFSHLPFFFPKIKFRKKTVA